MTLPVPGFINAVNAGTDEAPDWSPTPDAQALRLIQTVALSTDSDGTTAIAGVRPGDGLKVTLSSGSWQVAPGIAVVMLPSAQGAYVAAVDTQQTGDIDAADATNPRKDIVVLQVYDDDVDSSGKRSAEVVYVSGDAASTPTTPATPDGSVLLGTISVPASGVGSPTVDDSRIFAVASGGIWPTDTAPVSPYEGQAIYTSGGLLVRDSLGWLGAVGPGGDGWRSYSPSLVAWGLGNGTLVGKYAQFGKTIHYRIVFTIGSTSTLSGNPRFTLPATPADTADFRPVGTAVLLDTSEQARRLWGVAYIPAQFGVVPVSDSFAGMAPTNPWTWAAGDTVAISGTYEAA